MKDKVYLKDEIFKKLPLGEQIKADVDDELYLLKKRIQMFYGLSWAKARDYVNEAVRELYCIQGKR